MSYASKVFKVAFFITGNGHLKFAAYLKNSFVRTSQNGRVVLGAAFRSQSTYVGVGSSPTSDMF